MYDKIKLGVAALVLGLLGFIGLLSLHKLVDDYGFATQIITILIILSIPIILFLFVVNKMGLAKDEYIPNFKLSLMVYAITILSWVLYLSVFEDFLDNDFYPLGIIIWVGLGVLLSLLSALFVKLMVIVNDKLKLTS